MLLCVTGFYLEIGGGGLEKPSLLNKLQHVLGAVCSSLQSGRLPRQFFFSTSRRGQKRRKCSVSSSLPCSASGWCFVLLSLLLSLLSVVCGGPVGVGVR